jgi:uncharacterized protein (TIGR02117 family)
MVPGYLQSVASFRSLSPHRTGATLLFCLACSCAIPAAEVQLHGKAEPVRRIFVTRAGWHSGIVIKRADLSERDLPELRDFPDADYLEFGWGDWDYFQAPDPGIGLALKAAFWSSGSVLLVVGVKGAVEKHFSGSEIVEIGLADQPFRQLVDFVSRTFSRPRPALAAEARPGLDASSRFYRAQGRFYLFRTCNTWVAEALRSAGLPIAASTLTAEGLMGQVERFGVLKNPS